VSPGIDKRWATYPANLCLILLGAKVSDLGTDLGESVHNAIESPSVSTVGKCAAEHFEEMLSVLERMEHARQIGLRFRGGNVDPGRRDEMARLGTRQVKLSLQVSLGELGVKQSHLRCGVTEQLHKSRKANSRSQHLRGKCMSKLMWDDGCRDTGCGSNVDERGAEFNQQDCSIIPARQQPTVWWDRVERTEEAQPVDELTHKRVGRDQTFSVQLSQGNMNSPLLRTHGTQAIEREIDTFADTHAGVSQQQQDVTGEIVASE